MKSFVDIIYESIYLMHFFFSNEVCLFFINKLLNICGDISFSLLGFKIQLVSNIKIKTMPNLLKMKNNAIRSCKKLKDLF